MPLHPKYVIFRTVRTPSHAARDARVASSSQTQSVLALLWPPAPTGSMTTRERKHHFSRLIRKKRRH